MAHAGMGRARLDIEEHGRALRALDRALYLQPEDRLAPGDRYEALEARECQGCQ